MDSFSVTFFAFATFVIAIPTGIKIFNWLGTMYGGKIRMEIPMLFCIAFLFQFLIAGLTGIMLGCAPFDWQLNDSYFVIAHFHYVIVGGIVFGVFSGLALIGLTTSADANIGKGYTLLSIAGVILGGGEFVGGRVSPIGAVIGALTLTLAGSLLNFMRISPDWQVGAQGGILIIVLAARALINRTDRRTA